MLVSTLPRKGKAKSIRRAQAMPPVPLDRILLSIVRQDDHMHTQLRPSDPRTSRSQAKKKKSRWTSHVQALLSEQQSV
jgi:hypothetical protein